MANEPPRRGELARAAANRGRETPEDARLRQRARYQEALRMVWQQPDNCPICDSTWWTIGDLVNAPLRAVEPPDIASALIEPRVYVYAPITCVYCGYTIFF